MRAELTEQPGTVHVILEAGELLALLELGTGALESGELAEQWCSLLRSAVLLMMRDQPGGAAAELGAGLELVRDPPLEARMRLAVQDHGTLSVKAKKVCAELGLETVADYIERRDELRTSKRLSKANREQLEDLAAAIIGRAKLPELQSDS